MSLSTAYRATRALETLENYARLTDPKPAPSPQGEPPGGGVVHVYEGFWPQILPEPDRWWNTTFRLHDGGLSEWTPRVPGLFWTQGSEALRLAAEKHRVLSDRWEEFQPLGKSQKVLGGVGTVRFAEEGGYRLASLSGANNASAGVPLLISAEVWEHHRLAEGDLLTLSGQWKPMARGWAERFERIRGIPRGYLVVSDPGKVEVRERGAPTQFHPFSVMEYQHGGALLYDFVYATADTGVAGWEKNLEVFFEQYRAKENRSGTYLTCADWVTANPLWEAKFDSPEALLRANGGAETQLELLQARIREASFRGKTLEQLIALLARIAANDPRTLMRYSGEINLEASLWFVGQQVGNLQAAALINACLEGGKLEELVELVAKEYPSEFAD